MTKPVELRGTFLGAVPTPRGTTESQLELSGTIDRTGFGLNWNVPLPGGGFMLPNEVMLQGQPSRRSEEA